ncbi:MAG: SRPBCC family protein [Myxococcota bacterium]
MARAGITAQFEVPAERLWALLRDFGNIDWAPGPPRYEVKGEGIGMTRSIFMGEGEPLQETLRALDEGERSLRYEIQGRNPLPVSSYVATMQVQSAGADRSVLEWSCRFEPKGVSEDQASATIRGLYETMAGSMRRILSEG